MADKRLRRVYMKRQKRGEDEAAARLWSRMLDQIIIRGSMDIERGALRRASG